VWQPADVGFVPTNTHHFDADQAAEVHGAAEETAVQGALLAEKAGFRSPSMAVEVSPMAARVASAGEPRSAEMPG
jgi:hypothetical protein